jgi:hypothetical protein
MSAINITQVQVLVRLFQILSFLFFISLSLHIFLFFENRVSSSREGWVLEERVVLKRARRRQQQQQIRRGDENKRGFFQLSLSASRAALTTSSFFF